MNKHIHLLLMTLGGSLIAMMLKPLIGAFRLISPFKDAERIKVEKYEGLREV